MPLDPAFAGRSYPPGEPYTVTREKVREFADAIGDPSPAYRDPAAARALGHPDVVAPPTFPTVLALRAAERVVLDPALGLDWTRVVHAEERYAYARPVHAGDTLRAAVTIERVRSAGGNDMVSLRTEMTAEGGEAVLTAHTVLVARGPEPGAPQVQA